MVRNVGMKHYENLEFLLCGLEQELRASLHCPEKTRKRDLTNLPQ